MIQTYHQMGFYKIIIKKGKKEYVYYGTTTEFLQFEDSAFDDVQVLQKQGGKNNSDGGEKNGRLFDLSK